MDISGKSFHLSDGRPVRVVDSTLSQGGMFFLREGIDPKVEGIAKLKDIPKITENMEFWKVVGLKPMRVAEYGFFHYDINAPLGKELLWVEPGIRFRKIIPDVPVQFDGKEISLQKVVGGMGIYDSVGLLDIKKTDENEYTVSPIDLAALEGRVRAMRFMRNGWAKSDEHGFPDGNQPDSEVPPHAKYGSWDGHKYGIADTHKFNEETTGYHGSFILDPRDGWDVVIIGSCWNDFSPRVMIIGHEQRIAETRAQ